MTDQPDLNLWEVRKLDGGLALELHAGDNPALILVEDENRVRVELSSFKGLVAALTDVAADLAGVLTGSGCIMLDELPDMDDPGFFTWPGCASMIGIFLAVLAIAPGMY